MKCKNIIPVNYFYAIALVFLLLISCLGNRQIVINDTLKASSDKWKATIKGGVLSIGSANFGPYKTISATKLDSAKLKINSGDSWIIPIFSQNSTQKKRKVYALEVAQNENTAKTLIYVWTTTHIHEKGIISVFDEDTSNKIKDGDGKISINNSLDSWEFKINTYGIDLMYPNNIYKKTTGFLIFKKDTITIVPTSNFMDKKPEYAPVATKGIVLLHNGETYAALQLLGDNNIWIRKDLPSDTQLAIAGLFSAILGTKDL